MTTMKLIPSSSKYCGSPPPQSNFDCIGLAVVDEHPSASATSNESGCANFFGQAHHQNLRRVTDIDEFETFEVSSQFSDVVCGAYEDDGVALADIEQLCSDLLTGVDESAAAAVEIVSHDTVVGELMSPASRNRKASEGEGCSITSSLQSSVIHHNYVTKSYAKWTASPCYFSAGKEAPYLPSVSIPGRRCPPQGYGVPALIAVPQANPQKTTVHSVMAAPELSTAVSMANPRDSSSQLFQINHSTKFCDVSLLNETQFSTGVATSSVVCPKPSEHTCSKCRHPGSDIKIKNCPNNCTYHARCLDLISACNQKQRHPQANVNSNNHVHNDSEMTDPSSLLRGVTPPNSLPLSMMDGDNSHGGVLSYCPSCFSSGTIGIEILPLDFDELDSVQRKVAEENYANKMSSQFSSQGVLSGVASAIGPAFKSGMKRPREEIFSPSTVVSSTLAASPSSAELSQPKCYDPDFLRTGRWTKEEVDFCDALVALFLVGKLPLSNGLKLNDFLHNMLKSKQSRLAKKMKNAKLSTKYFFPKSGYIDGLNDQHAPTTTKSYTAEEVSKLEMKFITSIRDPVERSEVSFHMQKEWRDHFAQRCHYLHVDFDGRAWLSSVDEMERRLTLEKNRIKAAKRMYMMNEAMGKDASTDSHMPGVFIDVTDTSRDDFDMIVDRTIMNTSNSQNSMHMGLMNTRIAQESSHGFGEHNPSPTSNPGASAQFSKKAEKEAILFSASSDSNFKNAAPFLSGVVSFIERNSIPFEHIDIWVPSYVDGTSCLRTGSKRLSIRSRLVFGGSATVGVQIVVNNEPTIDGTAPNPSPMMKRSLLTDEDKTNFSMFGTYSEKFSFDTGCGLPGRVFQTGVPAWEEFLSEVHPSLFERRGGAIQFGIKSALALPIEGHGGGRVVLCLYSKYDRQKDVNMLARLMNDLKLLNPAPRWQLVVDVGCSSGVIGTSSLAPPAVAQNNYSPTVPSLSSSILDPQQKKKKQVNDLIFLLGEQIPLDVSSALGQQIRSIMSLRLVLLRPNHTPEEEQLVNTILVLYDSYVQAGRRPQEIACMLARDFCFHLQHGFQQQMIMSFSQGIHHPTSLLSP